MKVSLKEYFETMYIYSLLNFEYMKDNDEYASIDRVMYGERVFTLCMIIDDLNSLGLLHGNA